MDAPSAAHLVEKLLPIVLPLLPSIIVGATPYPKASKALRAVSHVLQFLSVLSHKDCSGTFKAPGHVDRPCEAKDEDEPAVRERAEPEHAAGRSEEPSEGRSSREATSEAVFLRALVLKLLEGYTPPRSYLR